MRRRPVIILVALVAFAATAIWYVSSRGDGGELLFSGTIESDEIRVGSLVGGRVATVEVEEGAEVRAGQVIVTLSADLLKPQVRQQEGRVDQAKAVLARLEAGPRAEELERARLVWELADHDRSRLEEAARRGGATQRELDQAVERANVARASYDELRAGSRPEDIAEARARLEAEQHALAYLHQQLDELVIRSPADGVVQTLDLRPGDLVAAHQPVAAILEPAQTWVRVYVPETRLGLVHVGQPADVMIDTFPGRSFRGRVVEIRPRGEYTPRNVQTMEERQELVFGVKVHIDPAPELKPGMTATVRLRPPASGMAGATRKAADET